ncbi:MAG: hypothetical protein PHC88_08850, partial [Terrimicrobiaceae bacterium]|nr:hypothetical protein [Terrimicrobiaceae bacterium]
SLSLISLSYAALLASIPSVAPHHLAFVQPFHSAPSTFFTPSKAKAANAGPSPSCGGSVAGGVRSSTLRERKDASNEKSSQKNR